ncbi:carbohydrate-binding module family 48 protein, partial [Hydnomerulius pinastri MD-312]
DVILTGTFDQWSSSIHLAKGDVGFSGTIKLPWGEKVAYKYIVDGHWMCRGDRPQEGDGGGNINNIIQLPKKPAPPAGLAPQADAFEKELPPVTARNTAVEEAQTVAPEEPQIVGGLSGTAASVVDYVTSGLGAIVQSVTGVAPMSDLEVVCVYPYYRYGCVFTFCSRLSFHLMTPR